MRRQYHFVAGRERLDAWDVHRLVALAGDLPVEHLPVAAFEVEYDKVYWFGEGREPTVRAVVEHARLIDRADLTHPIILGADGRVMDGMHRIAKAFAEDRPTIAAVRFAVDPEPDHVNCVPSELSYDPIDPGEAP